MLRIASVGREGGLYTLVYENDEYAFAALVDGLRTGEGRVLSVRVRCEDARLSREMSFGEFLESLREIEAAAEYPRDVTVRFALRAGEVSVSLAVDPADMAELIFTTPDKAIRLPRLLGPRK